MSNSNSFAQGWQMLPNELKLGIIRLALPAALEFGAVDFDDREETEQWTVVPAMPHGLILSVADRGKKDVRGSRELFDTKVLPLLACPATAPVAIEAFYTQNTMRFRIEKDFSIRLPPGPLRQYVRTLAGDVSHRPGEFDALAQVARDNAGFTNLQVVHLAVHPGNEAGAETYAGWGALREDIKAMKPIRFKSKKLILTFWGGLEARPLDDIEDMALEKFGNLQGGNEGSGRQLEWCERWRVSYFRAHYEEDGSRRPVKLEGRWSEDTFMWPCYSATVKTVWLS